MGSAGHYGTDVPIISFLGDCMKYRITIEQTIKALSLECLKPQTVENTPRNDEIFREIDSLNQEFFDCSKAERISILAKVYELCLMMDVI